MHFHQTTIPGVYLLEPAMIRDERGFFARIWSEQELAEQGLETTIVQWSVSFNQRQGTLRGMHYQTPPYAEVKIVRCVAGAIYDVALDLRPHSPTFKRWTAVTLSAENHLALYIPQGCAHGFQSLTDQSEVMYQISAPYAPAHARGVRWDDPAFGIAWPLAVRVINERDRGYPDFQGEL